MMVLRVTNRLNKNLNFVQRNPYLRNDIMPSFIEIGGIKDQNLELTVPFQIRTESLHFILTLTAIITVLFYCVC